MNASRPVTKSTPHPRVKLITPGRMPLTKKDQVVLALAASMMFLDDDDLDESPLIQALEIADYNTVADFLDGTARDGKTMPHAERYWERTGRHLSSAQFKSAFRCRCVAALE